MNLTDLFKVAQALASQQHLAPARYVELFTSAQALEARIATKSEHVGAYEASRDEVVLDGTPLRLERWRQEQRLLCATRVELRRAEEALHFIWEELEREVALAQHRKASAERQEARA